MANEKLNPPRAGAAFTRPPLPRGGATAPPPTRPGYARVRLRYRKGDVLHVLVKEATARCLYEAFVSHLDSGLPTGWKAEGEGSAFAVRLEELADVFVESHGMPRHLGPTGANG